MRKLCALALSFAAVVLFAAVPSQAQTVITHHVRPDTQNGNAPLVDHMPVGQVMHLVITLPLRNEDELDQFLKDVYDPNSPSYRQFLTVDEFTARFGPTQQDYDAVIEFAQSNGFTVTGTSRNRLNVDVSGPVSSVEKAFSVTMSSYKHPSEARNFYAPDREPSTYLPFNLWHVSGLDNFSIPQPAGLHKNPNAGTKSAGATVGSGPSASFLGSDMRAAYYGGSLTGAGQSVGLLEFYGTDLADLNNYFANVNQTNNVPITLKSVDGTSTSCTSPGCDDTEQTLDMTQALGMAPGMSSLVMYIGSTDAAIFNAMATASPLNAQLACSWAWRPADPATDDPYFKEFAAQGQNLFVASGDYAKWPSLSSPYYYPAEDAYVTAVGGTDLSTSSAAGPWSSETAWADSGGGISPDKIAIPSWQATTASSCSACSKTYRNAPDVAANANFTFYVCADQTACTANTYGGTSFAAPMWAGYLALVNQQLVANGSSAIGFINPTLYSIGNGSNYTTDFHDITSGSNGYSATTSYDLVTGWGSPDGSNLLNALVGSLPTSGFNLAASPGSLTFSQGSSGNSTTISSSVFGGYSQNVTLSVSGLPAGVTASFGSGTIGPTGSTSLTFAATSTAQAGTFNVTVKGTGADGTVATTPVSVTVTALPVVFSISANPSALTISRASSGSTTITTAVSQGSVTSIALSASGAPSGVSVSFSPSSISGGNGSSTMKISVNRKASIGKFTITVKGTGGGVSYSTTFTLTVP